MEITAAIVKEKGGPFVLEQVELDAPRANEVLVKIVATGMCHTDMAIRDQQMPSPLPQVLGHEGAGIVAAVGSEVSEVAVGDHVVLTFGFCGHCPNCRQGAPTYCYQAAAYNFGGSRPDGSHMHHQPGVDLHDNFFAQSSFGTYAIAHENNTIKVTKDVPLELLGPLGCGIQTGAGAILNSLAVPVGTSIAIFGTGAVGLSAVMAAHVAGCTTIIAVDINPGRLEFAKELGATHAINSQQEDAVAQIQALTGGRGVHFSFDTTGRPEVIRNAVRALALKGTCGLVGITAPDKELAFGPGDIMPVGRTIKGIVEGDSVPSVFIPHLIELYQQGRFPFDKLVKFYDFDQINQAAEDSEKGVTIKPILRIARP